MYTEKQANERKVKGRRRRVEGKRIKEGRRRQVKHSSQKTEKPSASLQGGTKTKSNPVPGRLTNFD